MEDLKLKQRAILGAILGAFVVIIAVLAALGSDMSESDDLSNSSVQKEVDTREELELRAVKLVQDYNGEDGKGTTIVDAMATMFGVAYSGEDIANSPATEMGWYAFEDLTKEPDIYQVHFDFKTYREEGKILFYADISNGKIWTGNESASDLLEIVNTFN